MSFTLAPLSRSSISSSWACNLGTIASWSGTANICIHKESGTSSLTTLGYHKSVTTLRGTHPPNALSAAKPTRPDRIFASGIWASASISDVASSNSFFMPSAKEVGSSFVAVRRTDIWDGTLEANNRTRSWVMSANRTSAANDGAFGLVPKGKEQRRPLLPKRRHPSSLPVPLVVLATSVQGETLAPKASPFGSFSLTSERCTFRLNNSPPWRLRAASTTTSRRRSWLGIISCNPL
mmetsp:Transcript_15005/g.29571  ORF Transcript_15005/g.29571 Transcript_15005/m.29571 type:complete len:236 (-) Transcript_15005:15-722(-)